MRPPFRHLLMPIRVLTIGLLGGYVITCAILYFAQERFLFSPSALPPDFVYPFQRQYVEVALPVDGVTLAGVHFRQEAAKGVILYLHGNATTIATSGAMAELFLRHGYDVFLLDYRGYGKSTGEISSEADLLADAQAAYAYLRRSYRDEQIVLYGHSLGTGLAVHLAATHAPRLLILEAPYVSLEDVVAHQAPFVPAFLLKYPLNSEHWIGAVRCPVYLFHGDLDDLIPFESGERLRAAITAPVYFTPVIGAGHGDIPSFAVFQQQLDQILR